MILKRRVALNGNWLDEVDSRICISSVEPGDGKENISAVDAAAGYGQRITGNRRSMLDMVVKFRMLEHGRDVTGLQERSQLLEDINAWAAEGGVLTVNYKPGRQLNVILVQAPGEGSLWDYTKEFTMTFRAYAIPYWEDATAQSETIEAGATGDTLITIGGSAKAQCDVTVENTSQNTIDNLTVTIGSCSMTFSDLDLATGETLYIDHVDGLLRIRIESTGGDWRSAMASRSGSNDFLVAPGITGVEYSADYACETTVSWRARYL